jgi:malonyl-CoA/methylmalonyl-CoA synthetase
LIRGPHVCGGYWKRPAETAQAIVAGWLHTGDLARRDSEGYYTIVGRSKDLIISGGYNVYPKEIEGYIDEMPHVVESAVIGLPHPDFGEAVAAVVVGRRVGALDAATLIERLKERIANYKVPKRVFVVEELPRNTMGKVQKNVLRDRYKSTFTTPSRPPA